MAKIIKLQAIVPNDLKLWYMWRSAITGQTLNEVVLEALNHYRKTIGGEPTAIENSNLTDSNWRKILCK